MRAEVQTMEAEKAGTVELAEHIFGLEPRADILQRMVRWQLARRQAGTHKTKGRSEVNRTKKKVYKQKGTGGARHGSRRPGIFVGGGKAFGPVVRSHAIDLPKKVRALALKHALSSKLKTCELLIIDKAELKEAKTKALKTSLARLGLENALIIDGVDLDRSFVLAARGINNIDVLPVQGINVYDILRRRKLVLTRAAVEALEVRFK